ncbi:MAG: hypothetical protein Q8Q65_01485 [bacterium]|nr:hypothetical protein [bacterium]
MESMSESGRLDVLRMLNGACSIASNIFVIVVLHRRVYFVGPYLIYVFDDAGDWDYISWVALGQTVWDYSILPESIKDWKPSDEALDRIFHWNRKEGK